MRNTISRWRALASLAGMAFAAPAPAQTVTVGAVTVPQGASVAVVDIHFAAGAQPIAGLQLGFSFVRGAAVAASGLVTRTTGPLPGAACIGSAVTSPTGNTLFILAEDAEADPLPGGLLCRYTFPLDVAAALGSYPFTVDVQVFADPQSNTVSGTVVPGSITIANGSAPSLSYAPPAGSEIALPGGAVGADVRRTIAIQANGGSGAGAVQLACDATAGFTLPEGGTRNFAVGAAAGTLAIGCAPGASEQTGTLSCTETDLPGNATRARQWPLRCPAGSGARIGLDQAVGSRGGSVAMRLSLVGDGSVHGAATDIAFDRAVLTPTQVHGIGGASCALRPAPSDNRIVFQLLPGTAPLPPGETDFCEIVFLIADAAALAATPVTLEATTCFDAGSGAAACGAIAGSVRVSGLAATPSPGSTLALPVRTGVTRAQASVTAANIGSTALDAAGCTADPAAAFDIVPASAFSIAAGSSQSLTAGCSAAGAGMPARIGEFVCMLQDTVPARALRYRLVCSDVPDGTAMTLLSSSPQPGSSAGDRIGSALARQIAPDGRVLSVIGAPSAGAEGGGRAFLQVGAAGAGLLVAARTTGADPVATYRLAASTGPNDGFGSAVAISPDGERVAVAAPGGGPLGAGRVHVFEQPDGGWLSFNLPNLTLDAPSGAAAAGTTPDAFGRQLAFAANGTLLVAAPLADIGAVADAGAMYAYAAGGNTVTAVLTAPAPQAGAAFGAALVSDGDAVAIGAPEEDVGGAIDRGAVYVIAAPGATPQPTRSLLARDGAAGDRFGAALDLNPAQLVAAAPGSDLGVADSGVALVFTGNIVAGYSERFALAPPAQAGQQAGTALAFAGNGRSVVLGAPRADVDGRVDQGRAFVFDVAERLVAPAAEIIENATGQQDDRYGSAIAADASHVLIGVPLDDNELGIDGVQLQVDEGRVDPYQLDRVFASGFE